MAKKVKPEGITTIAISMSDLVHLHCKCEAVFAEGLFGWSVDRQINKIGTLAKQAVEYRIGEELVTNRGRRKAIEAELRKPYEDLPPDEKNDIPFRKALFQNKEFVKLVNRETEMWDIQIPDFEFVPVKVTITDEIFEKVKKNERQIAYRERSYPVEVYQALGFLVDNGYLIETT